MCCGRTKPAAVNETLSNSFSIDPSADLTVQGQQTFIRQALTREDFQRINFMRKPMLPPPDKNLRNK